MNVFANNNIEEKQIDIRCKEHFVEEMRNNVMIHTKEQLERRYYYAPTSSRIQGYFK